MQKISVFFVMLMCILLVCLTGCTDPVEEKTRPATFKLGGIPCRYESYIVTVYTLQGEEILEKFNFGKVNKTDTLERTITIDGRTDLILVALAASENSDLSFFWTAEVNSTNTYVNNYYWLDYNAYVNNNLTKVGICEQYVQEITPGSNLTLDFTDAPYYLFKLTGLNNKPIQVNVLATKGDITVGYSSLLTAAADCTGRGVSPMWPLYFNPTKDPFYIVVRQRDLTEATSGTLTVLPDQKIELDGTVTDMLAGDNPHVLYGINTRTQKLYYIDPTIPEITDQFDLPCVNPRNLAYSASDKQLFIATERGNILAWNTATNSVDKTYTIPETLGRINDIEISSLKRRIYVLTKDFYEMSNLSILDWDSGEIISTTVIEDGDSLALNENKQRLFTGQSGYFSNLRKYSVIYDKPELEITVNNAGQYGTAIALSPDKSRIVFPCENGNGAEGIMNAFNTIYLQVVGKWTAYSSADNIAFSPDGKYLFTSSSNCIYFLDAINYRKLGLFSWRNLDNQKSEVSSLLAVNSDSSVLALYAKEELAGTIYFFRIADYLQQIALSQPKVAAWNGYRSLERAKQVLTRKK